MKKVFIALCVCGLVFAIIHRINSVPRLDPALAAKQRQNQAHVAQAMTQHRINDAKRAEQSAAERMVRAERNDRAIELCRIAARQQARHPSTVSLRYFEASAPRPDGLIHVAGSLSAANSFGLRLDHDVSCLITKGQVQFVHVAEVR